MMQEPPAQVRHRGPGHLDVTEDIGVEGLLQPLVAEVLDRLRVELEGGVVRQHIELAEFGGGLRDRVLAERRVLDVARYQQAPASFLLDVAPGLFGIDRDVRAFAGEQAATARPMPESAPVISAVMPFSLPLPR